MNSWFIKIRSLFNSHTNHNPELKGLNIVKYSSLKLVVVFEKFSSKLKLFATEIIVPMEKLGLK